jgi:molybdopterin-guanine dinucleotide biosynthesis protein A
MSPTQAQTSAISGIILSGGKSQRMGENKAFIRVGPKPIIETIVDLFRELFAETLIVTNQSGMYSYLPAKVYEDILPERGALGGLYTGLLCSTNPFGFVVGCDMPSLNASLISYLCEMRDGYDAVVPRTPDGLQPLHAVYSKNCLGPIQKLLKESGPRIFDFFGSVKVRIVSAEELSSVDPRMESFVNVNTPEDLERVKRRDRIE